MTADVGRDVTLCDGLARARRSVREGVNDDTSRGNGMTFSVLKDKLVRQHRAAKRERILYHAISHAPTQASRAELLGLQRGYNNL